MTRTPADPVFLLKGRIMGLRNRVHRETQRRDAVSEYARWIFNVQIGAMNEQIKNLQAALDALTNPTTVKTGE